jgi:hypothetical protein
MTDTNIQEKLNQIGANAYESIVKMVNALQCDYERLDELREERDGMDHEAWARVYPDDAEELAELEAEAEDCEDEEQARERIMEDPLSLEVRSDWHEPGSQTDPCEFRLVLCTGGPAVQIAGELDQNSEPHRVCLQVQDWFTPWTDYLDADSDVLFAYCSCFHFANE